ncbi:MAG: ATP-binding cassette domain-containing protein, partial [Pseudobdellovibrionaceae bacterium]
IPYLTVRENIELPIRLLKHNEKVVANLSSNIKDFSERLGIAGILGESVTELSVGQSQRVAVARALVGQPQLILADEPTSSLDSDHREKFIRLLFELCDKSNISVLFVSHDRSIEKLFSRSVSLEEINRAGQI